MAPRNNDGGSSYKKNFPVEDSDVSVKDFLPCLLHKKHKVVKLVKNQMQKINEEGLLCDALGAEAEEVEVGVRRRRRGVEGERDDYEYSNGTGFGFGSKRARLAMLLASILLFLLMLFLLVLLMVWISAGPLSNTIAHTPVPVGSFVQTEGVCSLEKKYLLRWSKPEYFE